MGYHCWLWNYIFIGDMFLQSILLVLVLSNTLYISHPFLCGLFFWQIQELVEAIVLPMTHKERFQKLGIRPPKGVLLYGPPGTGKTLMARACAAQTNATFLKLAGPQLVQVCYSTIFSMSVASYFCVLALNLHCLLVHLLSSKVECNGNNGYGNN